MTLDEALEQLVATERDFTADDLYPLAGHPDQLHEANGKNNTVGAVIAQAHKQGRIEPVGYAQSKQPQRKGGLIRVWRGVPPAQTSLL